MVSRLTHRSMAVKKSLRSNWHVVTIAVTAAAIVCAAVFLVNTMPPRSIAMATGPEGGGYYEIGRQYQALLARAGVALRLVATAGTVENLPLSKGRPASSNRETWTADHLPPRAAGMPRSSSPADSQPAVQRFPGAGREHDASSVRLAAAGQMTPSRQLFGDLAERHAARLQFLRQRDNLGTRLIV